MEKRTAGETLMKNTSVSAVTLNAQRIHLAEMILCLCTLHQVHQVILKLQLITINILSVTSIQLNTGTMLTLTDFILQFPTQAGLRLCGASSTVSGSVRLQHSFMTLKDLMPLIFYQCLLNITSLHSVRHLQCSE